MARSNTGSTSNWLSNATAPATANPISMSCWFYPANLTASMCLMAVSNAGATSYHALLFDGSNEYGAGDNRIVIDNSTDVIGSVAGPGTANVWYHAASVNSANNSRIAYFNGTAGTTNTTSVTPSSYNHTDIGAIRATTTTFNPINGRIGEAAIWNVALTQVEITALSKGVSPHLIRPANLVRYWPIYGRHTETCLVSGSALTVNGTMAQAEHKTILMPTRYIIGIPTGAATQTITGALFTDTDTFYNATLTVGGVTISGALYTATDTIYSATLLATYTISGALYTETDTVYGATLTPGVVQIAGALYTEADTFYSATLTPGAVTISGALYTEADIFYNATLTSTYTISGALYTETDTFYSSTLTAAYTISGALHTEADTLYNATLTPGLVTITGALYTETDTFYSGTLSQGATSQTIDGALFSDIDTFYSAVITTTYTISGALYTDADTIYTADISATYTISGARYDDPDTVFAATLTPGGVSILGALYTDLDTFFSSEVTGGDVPEGGATWLMTVAPRRRR